jgi:AraC-like DNA-binding protein
VLADGHERLGVDDLPAELQGLSLSDDLPKGSFHEAMRGFKRELVRSALSMHKGNKLKAARELGISRCYLHRLLNQFTGVETGGEETELQREDVDQELTGAVPASIRPSSIFRPAARIA